MIVETYTITGGGATNKFTLEKIGDLFIVKNKTGNDRIFKRLFHDKTEARKHFLNLIKIPG